MGRKQRGVAESMGSVVRPSSAPAIGNLTQVDRTDNGVSTTRKIATHDATNRFLSSCTAPPGGTCWKGSHDAAGNVTSLQQDANTLTFEYGSSNETRRSLPLGVEHRYAYDTAGERVAFWRSGEGTTFTLRDLSGKVLREVVDDGSGSWRWKEDYVWFGGLLLATVSADGGLKHYGVDHLGTPRVVTDRCGMAIARHDYYPYGEEATSTTQDAERMKFTGHERDFGGSSSTLDDLDYMRARYYGSTLGRFLSPDPGRDWKLTSPQSWNLFSYVRGNPLAFIDPTGEKAEKVCEWRDGKRVCTVKANIALVAGRRPYDKTEAEALVKKVKDSITAWGGKYTDKKGVEVVVEMDVDVKYYDTQEKAAADNPDNIIFVAEGNVDQAKPRKDFFGGPDFCTMSPEGIKRSAAGHEFGHMIGLADRNRDISSYMNTEYFQNGVTEPTESDRQRAFGVFRLGTTKYRAPYILAWGRGKE